MPVSVAMVHVQLRPVAPGDRELLYRVYASTRAEELAVVDWPEAVIDAFLRQQFDAQDRHYRQHYREASYEVIVVNGTDAGRWYVDAGPDETRIVDLAVLPPFRGLGVGSELMAAAMDAAERRGASVTLHVERNNPALDWYRRLGFDVAEDRGVYLFLRWWPDGEGEPA